MKGMTKQLLGQFYTTNYTYILQNMYIPDNISNIIEPFAGAGDLLNFITPNDRDKYNIECYDIEPKKDFIVKRDTLLNPPNFDNAFVITNPPYLARNKCDDKAVFTKYNTNDLYKCFLQVLIGSRCLGGILILPLNFLCSIRKADIELRRNFVKRYDILICNIFEEQVFEDTSYTICCFQFRAKNDALDNMSASSDSCDSCDGYIYPSNKRISFVLNADNNYTIGGKIYNLEKNAKYKIDRATRVVKNTEGLTSILVKCIDDNINSKICLSIVDDATRDKYIDNTPKLTARSYAVLVIEPKITLEEQRDLVNKFNTYMNEYRDKYNSLFLTNYRESNSIARKRISFGLVYEICGYLLIPLSSASSS
jgi:hypothetical protein